MISHQPILYLVYAIPERQLLCENGTSRRLDSLRGCFCSDFKIVDINLLGEQISFLDRCLIFILIAIGLNNFRYLFLARRLPQFSGNSTVLLTGIYSAFLGLMIRDIKVSIDLVDSLSLSDVRGIQSFWRCRPVYHFIQLPISYIIEYLLLSSQHIKSVFVATQAEQNWLQKIHHKSKNLHVLSNSIFPQLDYRKFGQMSPYILPNTTYCLAFIGSLDWWVNRRMLIIALRLLDKFLRSQSRIKAIQLHIYGESTNQAVDARGLHPELKAIQKGYFNNPSTVYSENHAAFLPNSIGRGFQNKLFSCLAIGLPTIAHVSMNPLGRPPHDQQIGSCANPVLFCDSESDYMNALLRVFLLDSDQRLHVKQASHEFLHAFDQATQTQFSSACNEIL